MNLETISVNGLFGLVIICAAVITVVIIIGKMFKKLSFKMGNSSVDIGSNNQNETKKDDDIMDRKIKLAKTHIRGISVGLEKLIESKIGRQINEPEMFVLYQLLTQKLESRIVDHIISNHIGDTQDELNAYTRIRTRELAVMIINFYDEFYTILPSDMRNVIVDGSQERIEVFLTEHLRSLYSDVKAIEKITRRK